MNAPTIEQLRTLHSQPRKGEDTGLGPGDVEAFLKSLSGWELEADGKAIRRRFRFKDYFHTMAFVNAVASIAHREDHHPDLEVHYDQCLVRFSTHDTGGLSLNDFICAARVDDLGLSQG